MSTAVAGNEGSSPEPNRTGKESVGEENVAPGEQAAEGESQEGGVVLGEEGVAPSLSQEDTAEATVETAERETSSQQTQVGRHCMSPALT